MVEIQAELWIESTPSHLQLNARRYQDARNPTTDTEWTNF